MSGASESKRIIASDPQGQAHFTALGVTIVIEALLKSPLTGFMLPEQIMDQEAALTAMQDAGVVLITA
ncbi:hypothetical protein AB4I99_15240 [Citrobacter murliniae]